MLKHFLGGPSQAETKLDSASSTSSVKHRRRAFPPVKPPVPTPLDEDEALLKDVKSDDELASRLLVQFPAYGTRSQSQNNLNQTADWLLGGTANIPSQQQLLLKQQQQEAQDEQENGAPLPDEKNIKSTNTPSLEDSPINRDWDDDEQKLWKGSDVIAKDSSKPSLVESRLKSEPISNTSDKPRLQDPSDEWLMAYYYHTGVTPKLEMRRPHPLFDRTPTAESPERVPRSTFSHHETPDVQTPTVHHIPPDEDDDQHQMMIHNPLLSPIPHMHVGKQDRANSPRPGEDRQHWMPDQLCKHCYACDTPFTVFRRRHHCRICGQVFCNSCSGYFVPSNTQQEEKSPQAGKTVLRTCKMCYEQLTERQQLLQEDDDAGHKRRKKDDPVSPPQQSLTQQQQQQQPQTPQQQPRQQTVSPSLQKELDRSDSVLHSFSKKRTTSAYTKRRLLSQQQILEQEEKEQTTLLLHQQNQKERQQIQMEAANSRRMLLPQAPKHGDKLQTRVHSSGSLTTNSHETHSSGEAVNPADVEEGHRHLGMTAASHLEQLGKNLLTSDAPLLWQEVSKQSENPKVLYAKWVSKLMSLATRCCATVEPNVKKGDLLDIRPYVKIKVIPGGTYKDCAYISGILFRKTVSHKQMAKEVCNPRIMLLSGGIEFSRAENQIASLETLMEQEGKYIEILVGKILKLKPDILMVGKAVSRKAQELLLKARVVLVQHVKTTLLNRISRQTGATIISSTDHIMNQFGAHVLGNCNRFRIIVARDNETWADGPVDGEKATSGGHREIQNLLNNPKLTNPERQAALAANMLGEGILDGSEAVKSGLAKRGVAQTYVMLEGCPKHLGCTVVLRGVNKAALKQVKVVFRFLVNAAYNLRLETSYMKERCARIHPDYTVKSEHLCSSSLCVDYGTPPSTRKIRPWNGGTNNDPSKRSISGQVTAFDHQSILVSSVWMTDKTQCCPAEVKGICYYSLQDVSLGQFLRDSCFNLSLKCQNSNCKKSVLDHSLSFVHNDGLINITVDHMDDPLPPAPVDGARQQSGASKEDDEESDETEDAPIATWTYCRSCAKVVTPLEYISEHTWKYSFGKFLESFFYNRQLIMNSVQHKCKCQLQPSATLYFGCGRLAARFTYERVQPFGVFVRKTLPIDPEFHRVEALRQLDLISMSSSLLFVKFDKHIEKVSREARALHSHTSSRADHLQTVLSELNRISSEVDHAAKTLQEKIASVSDKCTKDGVGIVNDALLRFPWFARRYLFMLTSAWNEKLSAAGQAIVAMKKLSSSAAQRNDSVIGSNVPVMVAGDQNQEELHEGMRRLRQLHEVYSRYNITDITTVLPIIPGKNSKAELEFDDDFEDPDGAIDFADGVDADVLASRRRLHHAGSMQSQGESSKVPTKSLGTRRSEDSKGVREIPNSTMTTAKVTPGGAVKSAITRFFNRGGRESDPYVVDLGIFSEGRPRLEPGVKGIVVPVIDDQLCTVIAYSLSSSEYATQFQTYAKGDSSVAETPTASRGVDPPTGSTPSEAGTSQARNMNDSTHTTTPSSHAGGVGGSSEKQGIERRMLVRNKSHIKHTFRDFDEKGQNLCKFVCTTYWATQFHAVRQAFLSPLGAKGAEASSFPFPSGLDVEQAYVQSLSSAYSWAASGGKSGASFARTSDDRFVIKCISKTELQMFLDCAPAYFEYLSKAFFHGLPTVLCKIVGVYQIGYHNRVTGKRSMEQVAVMQNIFYNKKISKTFDLKGSLRGRFAAQIQRAKDDSNLETPTYLSDSSHSQRKRSSDGLSDGDGDSDLSDRDESNAGSSKGRDSGTMLDGDFLEFTAGRPMPMNDRAKAVFHMSILNDTLFLSIINVLDYSILVGIDEERKELVVGIIDFMRQYDILKQMERVGKSLPMVVGSEAPTIIQPPLYKARFTNAMERYFMTVPSKWTTI